MGRGWKSLEVHAQSMGIKGTSGENSNRNEDRVIRNEGRQVDRRDVVLSPCFEI